MTPTKLRLILGIMLFVIGGASIGLFNLAHRQLTLVAEDVSHTTATAGASQNNLQALQTTQKELAKQKTTIQRALDIKADSNLYMYQDQIINDLNAYAKRSGVSIISMDFSGSAATGSTATGTGTPSPAPAAPAAAVGKTASVAITLKAPSDYRSLLNFYNMIEQSIPKLQIASVNLTKATEGSGITSGVLNIEVNTR